MPPTFDFEISAQNNGFSVIAGADEVGRGCFAGPVVAGCVCFGQKYSIPKDIKIDDSKKLTKKQRDKADNWIRENCIVWGIGRADVAEINKLGIKKATEIAFREAVGVANNKLENRISKIDFLLVDAFYIPKIPGIPLKSQNPIIKGDCLSFSIAAASIIAKVYRDRLMDELAEQFKNYGWQRNKGYGTAEHRDAIQKSGITKHHRIKFVETFLKNSKH